MATIEYWLQLEIHPWDVSPNDIDRMTGQSISDRDGINPAVVMLRSPVSGVMRGVKMSRPLREGGKIHSAMLIRRYTPNWAAPDDRKVNPWDLNEPDPTDKGTMGTIPGPTLECSVGDKIVVHFRNLDARRDSSGNLLSPLARTHSLHPHGIVFKNTMDGAFPLSPPDAKQVVGAESAAWASVGVTGPFKQGDRVPGLIDGEDNGSGGTFTYEWDTLGWPSTAGVWLYHDHAVMDEENVTHGAIGFLVIHNAKDPDDIDIRQNGDPLNYDVALLPPGGVNGNPKTRVSFKCEVGALPFELAVIDADRTLQLGNGLTATLNPEFSKFVKIGFPTFAKPPEKAMYLQLFHDMGHDAGMVINGRKYLGNTPTMIAGVDTIMRFGVMGMGVDFHTFHIHGHRWIIPGPVGTTPEDIMQSPAKQAVSQFEDTRVFGVANSFSFTVHEGKLGGLPSFMRAGGRDPDDAKGEWHMHCHVLDHMMEGMMGSLLVVSEGDSALALPVGVPMPTMSGPLSVMIMNVAFTPTTLNIHVGDTVTWTNMDGFDHTVSSDPGSTELFDSQHIPAGGTFQHKFMAAGSFGYHCNIHPNMTATIVVS